MPETRVPHLNLLHRAAQRLKTLRQPTTQNFERTTEPASLPVTELDEKTFSRLHKKLMKKKTIRDLDMAWERASDQEVVMNTGAGPCLIIFIHDSTSGEILSAHYPSPFITDAQQSTQDRLAQQHTKYEENINTGVQIPSKKEASDLTYFFNASQSNYQDLINEVQALINDGRQLDIYLFGQNEWFDFPPNSRSDQKKQLISEVLLGIYQKRLQPLLDLQNTGVSQKRIHDLRAPIGKKSQTDHVIYIPDGGLFHHRGNVLSS